MKKRKIEYFKYANPNPSQKYMKNGKPYKWQKPDCVVRAFALATDKSWDESLDILYGIAKEEYDVPNSRTVLEKALEKYGFEKVSCQPKKGEKRPTVNEIASTSQNKVYVLGVAGHEVCAKDGFFYDTWNCGESAVYSYMIKIIQ